LNAKKKKRKSPVKNAGAARSSERSAGHHSLQKSANLKPKSGSNNLPKLLVVLAVALVVGLAARFAFSPVSAARIQELETNAALFSQRGQWPQLEAAAQEWASAAPEDYQPWRYAAEAALQQGNPIAAVEYLRRAPEDAPVECLHQLSFLEMEALKDPLAAKATCEATLARFPLDPENHERLLFYYTMTAQRNAIVQEANRAIELGCDTLGTYGYLFASEWLTFTNGYETNQQWLQRYPGNELFEVAATMHLPSFQFLDLLAKEAHPEQEAPKPLAFAAEEVARLRQEYPENIELLAIETRNLCRSGDVDAVAARLALNHPLAGSDHRFWRFRGWYHSAVGEWREAIQCYERALELQAWDWASQLELAAAVRATEGVKAAADMQTRADEGKALMMAVQACPNIRLLQPRSLYEDLAAYFRLCGEDAIATALTAKLK
jgi:tetratricopeptide (TPR) repeat protein